MANREVKVTLIGDADKLNRAFSDAGEKARGFGKHMADVGKIAGGFVIGAALTQAPALFQSLTGAASDMNETVSKARTIFGDQGSAIEQWASGAAKGFGQSKQGALDAAATFGNLFVQLGIGTPIAADMSQQMVELASDFASFHNADPTEVIEAQTAAFRGEYDALQRFVPTINAAAVEQKALAMTGKAATKELTLQEKAIATQTLMMEGAGDAMGDFDRTAKGAANQERILAAQMADLSATIGQKLLPVKIAVGNFILNVLIPAFAKLGPIATGAFDAISGAVGKVSGFIQTFIGNWQWIMSNLTMKGGVADVFKLSDEGLDGWQRLVLVIAEVRDAYIGIRDAVQPAIEAFAAFIQQKLIELAAHLQDHFGRFPAYYSENVKPALDNIMAAVEAVVGFFREHWPQIMTIVQPILDELKNQIETFVTVVTGLLNIIILLIKGDWSAAWDAAKQLVADVVASMIETVTNLKDLAVAALTILKDLGLAALQALWDLAKAGFAAMRDEIVASLNNLKDQAVGAAGSLRDSVVGVWNDFRSAIAGIVSGIVGDVVGAFQGMVSTVTGIVNGLIDGVNGVIGRINSALEFSVSIPGVNMPGPIPDIPGTSFSFDAPDLGTIPRMARGGIVNRPTLAMIGEAGPEAVVPLNRAGGFGNVYGNLQIVLPNMRNSDDFFGSLDRIAAW